MIRRSTFEEIGGFSDLSRFPSFEDEWLRGGPVQRWVPKGFSGKPVFVFETGGTTGIPKTRVAFDDFGTGQQALEHLIESGKYEEIAKNWGVENGMIDKPVINGAIN